MSKRRRLPTNSVSVAMIAIFFILIAIDLPSYSGQALVGAVILLIALVAVGYLLICAGQKKDARRLVGAEIFEDEKTRLKNRANGVTTFSLEYQDGSRELVTIRDGSTDYNTYNALRRQHN
ncbi:MAG: hypothetical protein VB111_10320 [Clostridiaceae bacterium]|nr:hypothetical protein [Clostridiaceae bacterium]